MSHDRDRRRLHETCLRLELDELRALLNRLQCESALSWAERIEACASTSTTSTTDKKLRKGFGCVWACERTCAAIVDVCTDLRDN